jgi:hypothetical protein
MTKPETLAKIDTVMSPDGRIQGYMLHRRGEPFFTTDYDEALQLAVHDSFARTIGERDVPSRDYRGPILGTGDAAPV